MSPDPNHLNSADCFRTTFATLIHDLTQSLNDICLAAKSILDFQAQGNPLTERAVARNRHLILAVCEEVAERIEANRSVRQITPPP